jgi:pyridoxal phosphate enzyme (YggS family)
MLLDNLTDIRQRIAAAATRANRSPSDIKLVAVSKRIAPEKILAAIDIGHSVFGENYLQEALEKIPSIKNLAKQKTVFHFIGKLQRNKTKKAAELFDVIETVDSIKLGLAVDTQCAAADKSLEVYVQVNIGAERSA